MAWTGLTLTVDGQIALNQAQLSNKLNFKSIIVGDGAPPANFRTSKALVHELYKITDLKIDETETGCTLTADFPDVDYDYYFREIGIIVTTEDGDKLYVYDNCGEDAQCIVNSTGTEKTRKRIRLSLNISDVENITVSESSILYVAYDDFEKEVEVIHQMKSKLDDIEAGANKYIHPDQHPADMITEDATHRFVTEAEKSSYSDKYTKNEVDNKLAALETNIDWKESVETFSDIAATYPNPQDGWTVNVKDTDYTYRYNGSAWVTISANAIPKATSAVDGLLSKEDKAALDSIPGKYATKTEVDTLKKSVSDGKAKVAAAVTAKGVSTAADAAFQTMADNITLIETGISEAERKQMWGERFTAILSCGMNTVVPNAGGNVTFYFDPVDAREVKNIWFECRSTSLKNDESATLYVYVQNREEDIFDNELSISANSVVSFGTSMGIYEYDDVEYMNQIYIGLSHNLSINVNVLVYPTKILFQDGTKYTYSGPTYTQNEVVMSRNAKSFSAQSPMVSSVKNYYIKQTLTEMYKGIVLQDNEREVETTGDPYMQMTLPVSPYVKTFNFRIGFKNTTNKAMTLSDSRVEIIFKNQYDNILKRYYFSADIDKTVGAGNTNYYYSGNIDIKTGLSSSFPVVCADIVFMTDTKTGFIMSVSISDVTFTI